MGERAFSTAVAALHREHSLRILRFPAPRKGPIATDASRALGIHATTAGTFLAAMHGTGLLERRARR